jgi:hypothetical protein
MACQKDYDGTQREVINDIGPEASDKLIRIVMLLARRMLKAPEGE